MDEPGLFDLGDLAITSAVTDQVMTEGVSPAGVAQAFLDRLDGMLAATIEVGFSYGSGGTNAKVMIDTRLDGANWIEVARLAFATTSAIKIINLSGLTPRTTPVSPSVLSDDTCLDGILGSEWRARRTTTGTYAGTVVSVRMMAR